MSSRIDHGRGEAVDAGWSEGPMRVLAPLVEFFSLLGLSLVLRSLVGFLEF